MTKIHYFEEVVSTRRQVREAIEEFEDQNPVLDFRGTEYISRAAAGEIYRSNAAIRFSTPVKRMLEIIAKSDSADKGGAE